MDDHAQPDCDRILSRMDTRTPLLIGSHACGQIHLTVINCTHWRAPDCSPKCTIRASPSVVDCAQCSVRRPIVGRERWRGMGDLLHALIRVVFLGRVDIAERMASRVESLWRKPPQPAPTPGKPGPSGGCGCAARREVLNRAIPFGKD